jgi:peptide/nickel transport system substrate-binding protein
MTTTVVQARLPLADPHDCTDVADALTVLDALYDPLLRRVPGGFAPALATGWTVNEDARHWTFTLRRDVRFHDGTEFDAEAAAMSLRRMASPEMGATLGAPGVYAQYLGGARITAAGADRLVIDLDAPMADLPDVLCYGYMIAPDALAAPRASASGTGPWRVTAVGEDSVEAEAEPGHHDGPPRHQALRWQRMPDAAARLEALARGEAPVAGLLPFDATAPEGCTLHAYTDPMAVIFLFNPARPALADPRIRRALNLALDRPALVEAARGGAAEPLHGFVSPVHMGHVPTAETGAQREAAKRLLAEAGVGDGLSLTVDTPTALPDEAEALTAAVAEQLKPLGVEMTVRRWEDREAYAHRVRRSEIADMCVFDSSPMSTFRVLHEKIDSRVQGSWWLGYHNPAVEGLIDAARGETDAMRRTTLYQQCFRLLQDDPPWLYCYCHRKRIGLAGDHPGWQMRLDGVLDMRALP